MKIAVFTAITAGKDARKDPPLHEGVDRILYTDQPADHVGSVWDVRPACSLFTDPRRNSRAHKILAHQYLPDYDFSLWIDGSIRLVASPRTLVDEHLADADIAMFAHPTRSCLYVEAESLSSEGGYYDRPEVFTGQVEMYRRAGYPPNNGLNEGAVILRRHNDRTAAFNNAWWSEYCRHSCRDQMSANFVMHKLGVRLVILPGTVQENPGIVYYEGHLHW